MEGQKQYSLAHLNAMFDLMSKAYVDVTMQGKKGMNEHKALISMIDRSNIPGKVIVLMDRGYESFNNIAHLQEKSGISSSAQKNPMAWSQIFNCQTAKNSMSIQHWL